MIKVCFVSGSFPEDKCGVGDYSYRLATSLAKMGIKGSVITSSKNLKKVENVDVYNQIDDWSAINSNKVLKIIKKINPDIVHIQYPTVAYGKKLLVNLLPIILKLKGYKVVTTLHEYGIFTFLGKLRLKGNTIFSDSIIVADPTYIDIIKNRNVEYINIASNIPKSQITDGEVSKKRDALLKGNDKKIIGYFGFVTKTKGFESILNAMKVLKDQGNLNSILLVIAELKKEDEYHKTILELISKLGLKEDVVITGYLEDIQVSNNLKMTDFVVLPFTDGISPKNGSMLAAVQEGKKVITTKNKQFNEKIQNLYYIDRYDDINQLADKIKMLQEESSSENKFKNTRFTWHNIADRHVKVYEKILGGRCNL